MDFSSTIGLTKSAETVQQIFILTWCCYEHLQKIVSYIKVGKSKEEKKSDTNHLMSVHAIFWVLLRRYFYAAPCHMSCNNTKMAQPIIQRQTVILHCDRKVDGHSRKSLESSPLHVMGTSNKENEMISMLIPPLHC